MRVLVADDDRVTATIVSMMLKRLGLEPTVVHDGTQAWELLQSQPDIALAVVDWIMPGMEGPELCRRIRSDPRLATTYLLLLTSCDSRNKVIEGLDAGANDYLVKPIDKEEFRARINVGLRMLTLQERLKEQVEELQSACTALDARTSELNANMERYKLLVEGTQAIPWEIDGNTFTFSYISPQANRLLGFEADAIGPGSSLWDIVHPDDRERVKNQMVALVAGAATEEPDLNFRLLAGHGGTVDVHSVLSINRDGANVVLRGIILDVTSQKKLEFDLHQAQKLESVGRLAAGVAHEINTPVQFVSDSVHFVRDSVNDLAPLIRRYQALHQAATTAAAVPDATAGLQEAEDAVDLEYLLENLPKALDRSLDGLDRVATIVRSMKQFAHPDQRDMTAVDLNQAIVSTLTIARHEYKFVADVELDCGELPPVTCYPGDINQVVLNLVVNAAHAIEDVVKDTGARGRITVQTRCDGDMVVIRISDTGPGIPKEIQARVFEPFFTTKEVGKGTGQGLAIARSVVHDKHRGQLAFESELGAGTTFSIRLPIEATA